MALGRVEGLPSDRCSCHRRWLAPRRVWFVLEASVKDMLHSRKEANRQKDSRFDLPHGRRESHLGCAAYSRRTAQIGIRHLRTNSVPLGAKGTAQSGTHQTLADISAESS